MRASLRSSEIGCLSMSSIAMVLMPFRMLYPVPKKFFVAPTTVTYCLHGLRTNPSYNMHLSEVRGTVEDQRRWIENYKAREAKGTELYYIIERLDGTRCGTVRLYDIMENEFTWGSWILDHNKPQKAALESAVLSFGIGFGQLQRQVALIDVRTDNERALKFYRRLGMQEVDHDDQDTYFTYDQTISCRPARTSGCRKRVFNGLTLCLLPNQERYASLIFPPDPHGAFNGRPPYAALRDKYSQPAEFPTRSTALQYLIHAIDRK